MSRPLAIFCVLAVVASSGLAVATVAGAAADATDGPTVVTVVESSPPAQQATNTTVRQEHPDDANEDGDTAGVADALTARLSELLGDSAIQLSQGQYQLADQLVGERYEAVLSKYVDVAGDVGQEDAADGLQTAKEHQENLSAALRTFNRTYEAYRDARAAGNETKARELARELLRLEERISDLSRDLTDIYAFLENETDTDLDDATEAVRAVNKSTTNTTTDVRSQVFIQATLSVSVDRNRISFASPLRIAGALHTENGSAIANHTAVIVIGDRSYTVTTNATGEFVATYRPVRLRTDAEDIRVSYEPLATSLYLGSSVTVPVTVSRSTASVSLRDATRSAAYMETVTVRGVMQVEGTGVPNAPVVASVAGTTLARGQTDDRGRFDLSGPLPSGIETGTRDLGVRLALADRAVRAGPTTTTLSVESTDTALSVQGQLVEAGIQLSGSFETVDGAPIGSAPLQIEFNESVVASIATGGDGTFATTQPVPTGADGDVAVTVRYADPTSNLRSEHARITLSVSDPPGDGLSVSDPPGDGGSDWTLWGISVPAWATDSRTVGAGLGVVLLGAIAFAWYRRTPGDTRDVANGSSSVRSEADLGANAETESLETARAFAEEGNANRAVETAYSVVRAAIAAQGIENQGTHWEFYRRARASGVTDRGLESLTETYERAVYSADPASESDAQTALEAAGELLSNAVPPAGAPGESAQEEPR